jgi:hypothetical protein
VTGEKGIDFPGAGPSTSFKHQDRFTKPQSLKQNFQDLQTYAGVMYGCVNSDGY